MSNPDPSIVAQISEALETLERIQAYLLAEESLATVPASRALSAYIDINWAITRLARARDHLDHPGEGPGYDC